MTAEAVTDQVRPEVRLVQALIVATREVLGTMAQVDDVRKIGISTEHLSTANGQMASIVDVDGTLRGWIALDFENPLAKSLTSKMLDDHPDNVGEEEIKDCVKELANMISGSAKKVLSDNGTLKLKLSIPSLVASQQLPRLLTKETVPITLTFEANGHPFWVIVNFVKGPPALKRLNNETKG